MRTRRQDKIEAEAAETASARSEETNSPPSPSAVAISKLDGPLVKPDSNEAGKKSKLPVPLQFPLVVILSLAVSSVGYSLTYPYTKAAIAVHARSLDSWGEYGALFGWRM
jgi:hypothetical protein